MNNAILTIFTPTYNRAHTLTRLYESLCRQTCREFSWLVIDDGSTDHTRSLVEGFKAEKKLDIHYIYKENGGLHTGYNAAYATIQTALCVCIDSDDAMPPHAVRLIIDTWREKGSEQYAGIIGLDYDTRTGTAIGGPFPAGLTACYFLDLYTRNIHRGDTKQVMRTDLMRRVAPQIGYPGEKNFNPVYMLLQVCDTRPLLVLNANLCDVEYQNGDSMSAAIFRQYVDSPRSFAKMRLLEMQLRRNTAVHRFRSAAHYVAECLIVREAGWLTHSPRKLLTIAATPLGFAFYLYIRYRSRRNPHS